MDIALVEAEIYGQVVVQSKVMNGVQYIKGKKRMVIIAEAMSSLMFQCFKLKRLHLSSISFLIVQRGGH